MSTVVIDTNIYTSLLRSEQASVKSINEATQILIPNIVLGELYFGFYNGNKSSENIVKLKKFLHSPRVSVLAPDEHTPIVFGEIAAELTKIGKPMQQNDIWIAALCKQNNFTLLTYDKGFSNIVGLDLYPL